MSDAGLGQPIERLVQRDRVRGRQRTIKLEGPRDYSDRPERSRLEAELAPDLAHEGGDGGLAARAGDSDDRRWLARIEARRGPRQRRPRVADAHEGRSFEGRRALRDDDARALGRRLLCVGDAVGLVTGQREEDVARFGLAAIDAKSRDFTIRQRDVGSAEIEDLAEAPHSLPTLSAS